MIKKKKLFPEISKFSWCLGPILESDIILGICLHWWFQISFQIQKFIVVLISSYTSIAEGNVSLVLLRLYELPVLSLSIFSSEMSIILHKIV